LEASEAQVERVAALMAASGVQVAASALRARIADADSGVLLAASACVSWTLDGGALHLYDFALGRKRSSPSDGDTAEPVAEAGSKSLAGPKSPSANDEWRSPLTVDDQPLTSPEDGLQALLEAANRVANGRFAAVVVTTLWADDSVVEHLLQNGFVVDWDEADVRNGQPARLVGLVREVT
jgi:hypothetical protein